MMNMQEFLERGIRDILSERPNGYDATRACSAVFECELALMNYLNTHEFSNIAMAWSAAKRGLIYAVNPRSEVSPRSEAILKLVDTINRWSAAGLLDWDASLTLPFDDKESRDDNDVA